MREAGSVDDDLDAREGDAPTETIAFMLTDVEGSTRLWERDPTAMRFAMARLDAIIAETAAAHGGHVVRARGEGDSSFTVFKSPSRAVSAAVHLQRALGAEPWPAGTPIRVRLAVHVGEAQFREGDYYGSAVNRCARLRGLAYGGQAVISAATQALVVESLPEGVWLMDLGSHRLKDLAEPERIYQLCHVSLPRDFPELRGLEAFPNNLPIRLTSFIGREAEISEVQELLRTERLVTLTGTGGSGKTSLALEVAARVSERFEDGVWFVDLSSTSAPAMVADAAAGAMGLRDRIGFSPGDADDPAAALTDAIVRELLDHRCLVVLDNCEHLVDAAATFARALLERTPHTRVLATSREVLGLPGEAAWRVPSLSAPDPENAAADDLFASYESVRLFLDRCDVSRDDGALGPGDRRAIAEICAQVDGIPLAIELAAARTRMLSLGQIADRLSDQMRLLAGTGRGVQSRQATLSGAITWSYDLLDEDERRLFGQLAVFSGGWTLEAAEAVCTASAEVLETLARLVDKSVVVRDRDGAGMRFRLLEPLRQFAHQRLLEAGDMDALAGRHLAWSADLANRAGAMLDGAEQTAALAMLDRELENLRTALRWAAVNEPTAILGIAVPLRMFWLMRGRLAEGRQWLEHGIEAARADTDVAVLAAHVAAARLAIEMGDLEVASRHLLTADQLADGAADLTAQVRIRRYQGVIANLEGNRGLARDLVADALQLARQGGDQHALCLTLLDAANMAVSRGENGEPWLDEGLRLARQLADQRHVAFGLRVRAEGAVNAGEHDRARPAIDEAVELARSVGDPTTLVDCLLIDARLAVVQGAGYEARTTLAEAFELSRSAQVPSFFADGLLIASSLRLREGSPADSTILLALARGVRARASLPTEEADRELRDLERACREALGEVEYTARTQSVVGLSVEATMDLARSILSEG